MLIKTYNGASFKTRHRKPENGFPRNCKFTLPNLLKLILYFLNKSLQTELNNFFKIKKQWKDPRHYATDGGFSKARKKLSEPAFIELLQVTTHAFYEDAKI